MADDQTAPATKADISMIMDELGRMYDAQERWKNELREEFHTDQERWKDEVMEHFDLVAENIREDFRGANREEIEVMKDMQKRDGKRITVLEQTVGLAA